MKYLSLLLIREEITYSGSCSLSLCRTELSGPASSASSRSLLEKRKLWPHPSSTESESLEWGPRNPCWKHLSRWLFFINFIYLFMLCWVFISVRGLSLVVASGGHSSSRCAGLSLSRPLLLRSTGSRCADSVVVAHGLSCSVACGIFPDQGSNPCPLHWQADSQPLCHQGSPLQVTFTCVEVWQALQILNINGERMDNTIA